MNSDLAVFLEEKYLEFNVQGFIEYDPVSIPHLFTKKQDIEISGFFAAMLAWGQRKTIINSCRNLIERMDGRPYEFIMGHSDRELRGLEGFVHRTFQATDLLYFIDFFGRFYKANSTLEEAFIQGEDMYTRLSNFHDLIFDSPYAPQRTRKHVATPARNSSCKRLNMYLRWMVRTDNRGVDFGIWKKISPSELICPFDVHVGRVSRSLGLVKRERNDWKAAVELTENLRKFDPDDPCKYDFALFGMGISDKYIRMA